MISNETGKELKKSEKFIVHTLRIICSDVCLWSGRAGYKFDEGTGTTVLDWGYLEGSPSWTTDTIASLGGGYISDYALDFPGGDHRVTFPQVGGLGELGSMEAWVKLQGPNPARQILRPDDHGFTLEVSAAGTATAYVTERLNPNHNNRAATGTSVLEMDRWYHLVAVFGTVNAQTLRPYITASWRVRSLACYLITGKDSSGPIIPCT